MTRTSTKDLTWVAFDTETSGKYPVGSDICEIAAVKWYKGQVVGEFQSFVAVREPMSEEVIKIHGITNEMLVGAPPLREVLEKFITFIGDHPLIAHHAPFDLGFLAFALEKHGCSLPTNPVVCSSLLSRTLIPESPNHRLQTLLQHLAIPVARAHRALDDSLSCLHLALECFRRASEPPLSEVIAKQGVELPWERFSVQRLGEAGRYLVQAIEGRDPVHIVYGGGSRPGRERMIYPDGLVRNPQGDFIVGRDERTSYPKRYFLEKVTAVRAFE